MTTVMELTPGDEVINDVSGQSAVFVGRLQHPIWPLLQMVIWRMSTGEWIHDALDARQDVGRITTSSSSDRLTRLRSVLLGGT